MSETNHTVEPLNSDDLPRVEGLLNENGLPYRDIRTEPVRFVGIVADGHLRGVGGLERYDTVGLLRSVAVEEAYRGNGLGTQVCTDLEARARDNGVETLYLLTTSAAEFFRARGYVEIDRSETPSSIRATTEFHELCPTSAVCMRKHIR